LTKNKLSHIAFILDGNKRWAKKNNYSKIDGYKKGFEKIKEVINLSLKIKLSNLTLFTLSSENINRNSVKIIFEIIYKNFTDLIDQIVSDKNIRIKIIGSKDKLPVKLINILDQAEETTKNNKKLI
jgi:Undecaprenyl pyrophosphate synthase